VSGTTSHQADELKRGYRLRQFVIQSKLGRGENGISYLAHDTTSRRKVAIKEYYPSAIVQRQRDFSVLPKKPDFTTSLRRGVNSFLKTAHVLSKVRHANIVKVLSVEEENGTAYMVMNYEEGETLAEFMTIIGTLNQSSLQRMFFPMLTGLEQFHALGLIHGDISPANIRIHRNGSATLLNFCSDLEYFPAKSQRSGVSWSKSFTPLEQISSGNESPGPWSDIYSLAATMFYGITGTLPEDAMSRLGRNKSSQPDRIMASASRVKNAFEKRFLYAIEHGLVLDPVHRPQRISEWLQSFQELDSGNVNDVGLELSPTFTTSSPNDGRLAAPSQTARNSVQKTQSPVAKNNSLAPGKKAGLPPVDKPGKASANANSENQVGFLKQHTRVIIAAIIFASVFGWIKFTEQSGSRDSESNGAVQEQNDETASDSNDSNN